MKIGILGSGAVGRVLATGFLERGHETMIGTRDSAKLTDWQADNPRGKVGSFTETASFGEIIVLAVKGTAAADVVRAAGTANLSGKLVIDTTNPIADAPPSNGVLKYFTDVNDSLMERLQREFVDVHFVKAFNSVGSDFMVDPQFADGKPTMFICGDNEAARKTATGLLERFGWEVADMGKAESARAIEPLCILWCIPGLLRGEWSHAFKLLKSNSQ